MPLARRALLALPAIAAATGAATAQTDPRLADRTVGRADAPVRVIEFFSLTCSHCAAFHRDVWPQVKRELVETGEVRMVWRDFPLDRVGLLAAAVARSLPAERYEGFLTVLLTTQDRWAFARGIEPADEIAKLAALAGMPRAEFDRVRADEAFQRAILEARLAAEKEFDIKATPSFVFGRKVHGGNLPFEAFRREVTEARAA